MGLVFLCLERKLVFLESKLLKLESILLEVGSKSSILESIFIKQESISRKKEILIGLPHHL